MKPRAILVGAGAIGRRHLEALAATNAAPEVHVVEPDPGARAAALAAAGGLAVTTSADGEGAPARAELLIVATTAAVRRAALEAALARTAPRAVLLEKILFQTRRDLDAVGATFAGRGIAAFVNCGRRGFPGYDALRADIAGRPVADFSVEGAGWGLCSNLVHFLDLAEHLTGEAVSDLSGEALDPEAKPAKRSGCVEMTGCVTGRLSGGGAVRIVCAAAAPRAPVVTLRGAWGGWRIDEGARTVAALEANGHAGPTAPFAARHVSEMPYLYDALLRDGASRLTPYAQSARQHALALDMFRAAMGISVEEDAPCPIS